MANNQKERREMSHIEENCKDNSIFTTWTSTWGLKIRPWYAVDKLKFSFIEKGSDGKGNSFDICMDTIKSDGPCMDNWAYDILHDRRLESILAAEKNSDEKYAKFYLYKTGDNAEKNIGITNSMKGGFCISGSILKDEKRINANIPISYHGLRQIAEWYIRSYEGRKRELEKMRCAAENKNPKASSNQEVSNQESPEQDSSTLQNKSSQNKSNPIQEKNSSTKKNNEKPANVNQEKKTVNLKTTSKITEITGYPGYFQVMVKEIDSTERKIIFLPENIKSLNSSQWSMFIDSVAKKSTSFTADVVVKNNTYYFVKFAA